MTNSHNPVFLYKCNHLRFWFYSRPTFSSLPMELGLNWDDEDFSSKEGKETQIAADDPEAYPAYQAKLCPEQARNFF